MKDWPWEQKTWWRKAFEDLDSWPVWEDFGYVNLHFDTETEAEEFRALMRDPDWDCVIEQLWAIREGLA